jgi:hypothetical protein
MSGLSTKWSAFWADAFASDGFAVYGDHLPEGERFRIIPRDASMAARLRDRYGIECYAPLKEADLRTKLMQAELSADVVEAKVQLAREWAETITRRLGPVITFSN